MGQVGNGHRWLLATLFVLSGVMHGPYFRTELVSMHVWRQTQTHQQTLSFLQEDNNLFRPRRPDRGATDGVSRMEFPLQQWLVAQVMRLVGAEIYVLRGCMFLLALLTLSGMYCLATLLFDSKAAGIVAAWGLGFSPTFFYHSFNPMPDNLALCFGVWGLVMVYRRKYGIAGVLLALATLCKLPFILLYGIPLGLGLQWLTGRRQNITLGNLVALGLPVIFPLSWYAIALPDWGHNNIVGGSWNSGYGVARLFDYFQHNIVSTLPEMLLGFACVPLFMVGLYVAWLGRYRRAIFPVALTGALLLLYFLYEIHAIGKAHDYYLYPLLPFLFLVAGAGGKRVWSRRDRYRYVVPLLLVLAPLLCGLRLQGRWDVTDPGFNESLLVHRDALRQAVPDESLVIAGNDASPFIYLYYVGKKGWVFRNDELNQEEASLMIEAGAAYLYSDSRAVEERLRDLLGRRLLSAGSIHVYELRGGP